MIKSGLLIFKLPSSIGRVQGFENRHACDLRLEKYNKYKLLNS